MSQRGVAVGVEDRGSGTVVFRLSGELHGTPDGYAFQDDVRRRIAGGARRIVVDVGGVERIDSSGIGILMAIMFSAHRAGGALVLSSLPPRIEKILDMAMLLERIEHAPDLEAALARLDALVPPAGG